MVAPYLFVLGDRHSGLLPIEHPINAHWLTPRLRLIYPYQFFVFTLGVCAIRCTSMFMPYRTSLSIFSK